MTILVCPLSQVASVVAARAPGRVVSALDPDFEFPELGGAHVGRHLRLRFHDIHVPTDGQVLPSAEHARELRSASSLARPNQTLVALADGVMRRDGRMLRAITDTGRGLPWIEVHENEAFEMPSLFQPEGV